MGARHPAQQLRSVVTDSIGRYRRHRGSLLARGLAYNLVLGLVPLAMLLYALATGELGSRVVMLLERDILATLPAQLQPGVIDILDSQQAQRGAFNLVTGVVLVLYVLQAFAALRQVMSAMLETTPSRTLWSRLSGLLLLAVSILMFYAAAALTFLGEWIPMIGAITGTRLVRRAMSTVVIAAVLAGLLRLFARRRLRPLPTLITVLCAALAWQVTLGVLGALAGLVAGRFGGSGPVAWSIVMLLWARILAEIIVIASLVTAQYSPPDHQLLGSLMDLPV